MHDLAEETIINQVLRAATLKGEKRVYFLGPFAKRLNFAAQQNRALNLVYALTQRKLLELDTPIAVVGAGLAGLMSAAALKMLGYDVHIFERLAVVLARQRNSRHRFVHPSVNYWPQQEDLDPTTRFPFFDWCSDNCSEVMKSASDEWNYLVNNVYHMVDKVHLSTEVTSYNVMNAGVTLLQRPQRTHISFGTVIYATGFEEERVVTNINIRSYWDSDNLEVFRDKDADARFVVSGIGDGGLIDALRLVHRDLTPGR